MVLDDKKSDGTKKIAYSGKVGSKKSLDIKQPQTGKIIYKEINNRTEYK